MQQVIRHTLITTCLGNNLMWQPMHALRNRDTESIHHTHVHLRFNIPYERNQSGLILLFPIPYCLLGKSWSSKICFCKRWLQWQHIPVCYDIRTFLRLVFAYMYIMATVVCSISVNNWPPQSKHGLIKPKWSCQCSGQAVKLVVWLWSYVQSQIQFCLAKINQTCILACFPPVTRKKQCVWNQTC